MHEPWYKGWNTATSPLARRIVAGVASSVKLYAAPTEGNDGLITVSLDATDGASSVLDALPEGLRSFLVDLHLLRRVPLPYLIPDPALLPPESLRFFHVDRTWADRLVDGALAAANLGTVDLSYSLSMMKSIRVLIDAELSHQAQLKLQALADPGTTAPTYVWDGHLTGLIVRSELVARWPQLDVLGFAPGFHADKDSAEAHGLDDLAKRVVALRQERIGSSVLIVIFAGCPGCVHLEEPGVGLRFGFDVKDESTSTFGFNEAGFDAVVGGVEGRSFRPGERLAPSEWVSESRSQNTAWALLQNAFAGVYHEGLAEAHGAEVAPADGKIHLLRRRSGVLLPEKRRTGRG